METQNPTKELRRAGLILGILVLFVVLGFVGMVGFDLTRANTFEFMARKVAERAIQQSARKGTERTPGTKAEGTAASGGTQSPKAAKGRLAGMSLGRALQLQAGEIMKREDRRTSLTREMAHIEIVPETYFKTPDHLAQVRKLNEGYTHLLKGIANFYHEGVWKDYARGRKVLDQLTDEHCSVNQIFERVEKIADNWESFKGNNKFDLKDYKERQTQFSEYRSKFFASESSIKTAKTALAIYHGDWLAVADMARQSRWDDSWRIEMMYLRRMGAEGQKLIAKRSAERNWIALKRSVLSIGPDFKLPHHEPGD